MRRTRRIRAFRGLQRNLHALSMTAVAVVVVMLALLQYRWIDEVSAAQEARAASRVREILRRITDAFDVEITRAVLLFSMPPMPGETTRDKLEQAWARWHHEAPWPRIVSGLWYLESDDHGWRAHSWGVDGTLDLRSLLQGDDLVASGREGDVVHLEARRRALIVDGRPCLLWPLPTPSLPPDFLRLDRVLICYDLRYLKDTFLPQLLGKHSAEEDQTEFLLQLELRGPASAEALMTADQLHVREDCLLPDAGSGAALSVGGMGTRAGIPTEGLELSSVHSAGGGVSPDL